MNKFIIIFIILLSSTFLFGQTQFYDSGENVLLAKASTDIKGSPYLYNNWQKGYVYDIKGDSLFTREINFNGHTGFFEIVEDGKQIQLNERYHNKIKLIIDYRPVIFENNPLQSDFTYKQILHIGSSLIMYKVFKVKVEEKGSSNYGGSNKEKKYKSKSNCYIIRDGEKSMVKLKSKFFEEYFDDKNLKTYIKKNKLDLKKDNDIVKLLQYAEARM